MLSIGQQAPSFTAPTERGENISLDSLAGKWVVLYFYPKDDTPGCTTEAKDFTQLSSLFQEKNAVVLGVSKDSVASHEKFCQKYDLSVTLVSDESGEIVNAYGVWGERSMYGKTFMGIHRTTYLIDPEGVIRHVWKKVSVTDHGKAVLATLEQLQGA